MYQGVVIYHNLQICERLLKQMPVGVLIFYKDKDIHVHVYVQEMNEPHTTHTHLHTCKLHANQVHDKFCSSSAAFPRLFCVLCSSLHSPIYSGVYGNFGLLQ